MMYNPSHELWERFHTLLYSTMLKYNGRPHWGKWFTVSTKELHLLYPKSKEFLTVRKQLDPKGMLMNKIMREVFENNN